ncbi:MAG: hypothetical protein ACXQTR_04545 [Candidatus Methanospirareceae archaeon]
MDQEEFEKYVLDRFECIDKKLTEILQRLAVIEENWTWIKRIGWFIIVVIAGKLGIDLSGLQP